MKALVKMKEEKKVIVVMGGSFNPPTLAHYMLMKEAINAVDADIGIFVPVSDAYLKRKMRHSHPPVVLPPELRIKMLRAMCTNSRTVVCEKEIGTINPQTVPTLISLQEENPDATLYFLMGSDKLKLLISLTDKRDFLTKFRVILYSRENTMVEEALRNNEVLSRHMDRIVILPQPKGVDGISSSTIRERFLKGENYKDMMHPKAWELFKTFTPEDFPDVINQFKGEFDFLSNRYCCRFVWQGLKYSSVEAAFKNLIPPSGWENSQVDIMKSIVMAKFEQNPSLMKKLADTGNRILINGNNKQESFWGVDLYSWQGDNHLGKILMEIRDKEV